MISLLLECCRAHPDPGKLRRLATQCTDWSGFIAAASRHKVAPLSFWSLNQACADAVPSESLASLHAEFRTETKRNLIFTGELLRILDLFQQSGVPAVAFKGQTLAWPLYPEPGLRCTSDLDLLVAEGDVDRSIDLLKSNGYRRFSSIASLRFYSDIGQVLLRRTAGCPDVDLHWRLTPAHFSPLDAADIRSRLAPVDIAGHLTPTFCPEDLLVYLCLNGAKAGWDSLAGVCDLDRLIDVCPLDWDAILSRAERQRLLRVVSLGLCLAQDLLGSKLPPEISSLVHADTRVVAHAASIRARLQDGRAWRSPDLVFLLFWLMEGAGRKVRLVWYLLQPDSVDWESLRIPEYLFPVYYFARPVRLAWKWCIRPIFSRTRG